MLEDHEFFGPLPPTPLQSVDLQNILLFEEATTFFCVMHPASGHISWQAQRHQLKTVDLVWIEEEHFLCSGALSLFDAVHFPSCFLNLLRDPFSGISELGLTEKVGRRKGHYESEYPKSVSLTSIVPESVHQTLSPHK